MATRSTIQATRLLAGPSRLAFTPLALRHYTRPLASYSSAIISVGAAAPISQSPARPSLYRFYASTSAQLNHPTAPSSASTLPTSPPPNTQSTSASSRDDNDDDSSSSSTSPPEPEPKGAYARFKLLTKKYGWYAVGLYTFLSLIDFSLSFLVVHALGVERIQPLWTSLLHTYRSIRYDGATADQMKAEDKAKAAREAADEQKARREGAGKNEGYFGSRAFWAEVVLAYGIHKTALLPLRAGLTVAWTPKIVAWLGRRGWIGKGGFGRAATHAQGKIKDASERVKAVAQRDKS